MTVVAGNEQFEICAVARDQWDAEWMNRQHLMWAIKDFVRVTYVQEPDPWHRSWRPRDEPLFTANVEPKHEQLRVLRLPKMLARRAREGSWNACTAWIKSRFIWRLMRRAIRRVLYFWEPDVAFYCRYLRPDVTVYHIYDWMRPYRCADGSPERLVFERACLRADIVIANTEEQARMVGSREVAIVPNGVNIDWYSSKCAEPADIARIPHPRIGYVGVLGPKVDLAWLEGLAQRNEWQIVLVGPVYNFDLGGQERLRRLCALPNVHYLGHKSASLVPAYMQALDVGLMNYVRGIHMEGASPLKLYEYLGAGIPIVGSPLTSLARDKRIAPFVWFADGASEAAAAIETLLRRMPDDAARSARKEFATENSWRHRARDVLRLIGDHISRGAP